MNKKHILVLLGPTASGKTALAVAMSQRLNCGIISADSRQIYRDMDIGTGKDLSEYVQGESPVPYRLIDIREAGQTYSVFEYQRDCLKAFKEFEKQGLRSLLCGGTGLYLESVVRNYELPVSYENPKLRQELEQISMDELRGRLSSLQAVHNTTDLLDRNRLIRAIEIAEIRKKDGRETTLFDEFSFTVFGLNGDRTKLRTRIKERLESRLKEGLVEEVKKLLDNGVDPEMLHYYGLEYRFVLGYIEGKYTKDTLISDLSQAIGKFAKRQLTWFRRMERNGVNIHWLDFEWSREQQLDRIFSIIKEHKPHEF